MTVDQLIPELIDCHQLAVGLVRVYFTAEAGTFFMA